MASLHPDFIKFVAEFIERETGIQYTTVNAHSLESRLKDIAAHFGYADANIFVHDLKTRGFQSEEREMLLDLATNNETSFFRDIEVFDFFRYEFIPKFTREGQPIRIWSAASSTGQEAYSLAISLAQLRTSGVERSFEMIATDISPRVLKQARSGEYTRFEVSRGLTPDMVSMYFDPINVDDQPVLKYKIKPDIARFIYFKRLNLIEPWAHDYPFDIIFCRNVLIYQDLEQKKEVISRLARNLVPKGFLVLGGAESMLGLSQDFDPYIHGKACVYRLKA
jgi:chemotaxis protein methyltransferase CheR